MTVQKYLTRESGLCEINAIKVITIKIGINFIVDSFRITKDNLLLTRFSFQLTKRSIQHKSLVASVI